MKLPFFLLLTFMSVSLFYACTEDEKSLGEQYSAVLMSQPWKYDKEAIMEAADFSQMSWRQQQIIEGTSDMMSTASIAFLPDSVMTVTLADGARTQGMWYVTADGKYLFLQSTMAKGQPQLIRSVTDNRVYVENNPEGKFNFPKIFVPRIDSIPAQ